MRTKALIAKKGADLTRQDAARHLGAHLCRCTGYVKILDAIELLASGRSGRGARVRRCRHERARATKASSSRSVTSHTSTTSRFPSMLHGAFHLAAARSGRHRRASTSVPRRRCRASSAVLTAADVPGALRVGLIHKDWPIFIPEGGRTSYLGDVLAMVVAEDRETARAAAQLVDVEYRPLAADRRPGRRGAARMRRRGLGPRGQRALAIGVRAGRRRCRARGERARGARGVPDPAHRARVPRTRVDRRRPGRAARRHRGPACLVGWPGRVGRPRSDRIGARDRRRARDRRARRERRCVRRQGGHGEPGPDRARGLARRPPCEVHALARGVAPHPPEAPPDPDGVLGGV